MADIPIDDKQEIKKSAPGTTVLRDVTGGTNIYIPQNWVPTKRDPLYKRWKFISVMITATLSIIAIVTGVIIGLEPWKTTTTTVIHTYSKPLILTNFLFRNMSHISNSILILLKWQKLNMNWNKQ